MKGVLNSRFVWNKHTIACVKVFQVPIDDEGSYITLLQILFRENELEKKPFASPVAITRAK